MLLLYACSGPAPKSALSLPEDRGPMVIAHGNDCGNGLYPGNTLLYLHKMVELGVDGIEVDLWLTADGHLVLMHDPDLEAFSDGRGVVGDLTLAQLRELNIAYHWTRDGVTYPFRSHSLGIVTLEEALQAVGDTLLILELKSTQVRAAQVLSRVLQRTSKHNQVIVSSFHRGVIRAFRRLSPDTATGAVTDEAILLYVAQLFRAENLLSPRYQTVQLPMNHFGIEVVTTGTLRAARKLGLHLSVWTVNGRADLQHYISLGVDGIVTDRPDLLMAILSGSGPMKASQPLNQTH
ncbi:glycerophosphodiester phosphodiesterase [Microbulbifer sp. 2205BS26-8]|uniref:glycerophosphodiester phosphodiesterase n=1 Tax=Microbulbifer sp. 2205BS26-8 TaxID=3064386 RepID=UPI00273D6AF6|nr:glycerophosphodiester phosphodiesterase [Microbulbifer sp. 2205BS26-8]MDP5209572.1 glycerophosphodiester phosphodiesterase [Microbulbifer sp. 2205BS26-8]